jgi:hypothetical protein
VYARKWPPYDFKSLVESAGYKRKKIPTPMCSIRMSPLPKYSFHLRYVSRHDNFENIEDPILILYQFDDNLRDLPLYVPLQIGGRPEEVSRIVEIQNPNASYVLLVEGADLSDSQLEVDWSRHLPPQVALDRKEHDKFVLYQSHRY